MPVVAWISAVAAILVAGGAACLRWSEPPEPVSVAVLPFADLSSQGDQEYLSDGIAVEILQSLSTIDRLRVIGRVSSFTFKGQDLAPTEIARQLGVTALLLGSVRRDGDRIRVSARLVRGADGVALWGETYEREIRDVFAIQDDVAQDVAAALRVKLLPSRALPRTEVPEAYLAFLLAEQATSQVHSMEDWARAERAYEKVIAIDPRFAPAWARVSTIWGIWRAKVEAREEDRRAARLRGLEAADQAIALAPDFGRGYAQRAFLRLCNQDVTGAQADANQALRLHPSDDLVVYRSANVLQVLGRHVEAVRAARRAVNLNPLSSFRWQQLALVCLGAGDHACVRKAAERALEISPTQAAAEEHLAVVNLLEGRAAEVARWAAARPDEYDRLIYTALAEHALGHPAESERAARAFEAGYGASSPWVMARIQAWRGRGDEAFDWLERSRVQGTALDVLPFLASDPLFQALHADPRWRPFLRKLNIGAA
jgi:TolB-like protein/tetratricopeptide (TPR) repeat protein